jgi:hypothetical protein
LVIPHILLRITIAITKNNINPIIVGIIAHQNCSDVRSFTLTKVLISGLFIPRSFNESLVGKIITSLCIFLIPFSWTIHPLRVAIALFPSINISEYSLFENFSSNIFNHTSVSTNFCASFMLGKAIAIIIEMITKIISGLYPHLFLLKFKFGFIFGFFLVIVRYINNIVKIT